MDTIISNNVFNVHISEEHIIQFTCVLPGLYLFDTTDIDIHKLRNTFSFLNASDQNKNYVGNCEVHKDFHYANGVMVFHTISRKIGCCTVSFPISKSKPVIMEELKNKIYNAGGFCVMDIHDYVEFDKIKVAILLHLNFLQEIL